MPNQENLSDNPVMIASRCVAKLPSTLALVESACAEASRRINMLRAATPLNFEEEVERAVDCAAKKRGVEPRFEYREVAPLDDLGHALDDVAEVACREGPWGELHAARARELSIEARLVGRVGMKSFGSLAASRFGHGALLESESALLAREWIDAAPHSQGVLVRSDDEDDPGSLIREMRRVVSLHRLPVRVVVVDHLAALAAVGDDAVYIARGRSMSEEDVARTVLHEIEGHLLPHSRAKASPHAIYRFGTARGSDGQEGYALSLERRHGFLRGARRRELALRHLAAVALHAGESCADVIVALMADGGGLRETVRATLRAHRGGSGGKGGLGRERAYLPSLLAVERLGRDEPDAYLCLSRGRVGVDAAKVLSGLDRRT